MDAPASPNARSQRLGIPSFYGVLPIGHPPYSLYLCDETTPPSSLSQHAAAAAAAAAADVLPPYRSWWFHADLSVTGPSGSVQISNFISPHEHHNIKTTLVGVGTFSERAYGRVTSNEWNKKAKPRPLTSADYLLFHFLQAIKKQ